MYNILIKNAWCMDPLQNINKIMDVAVKANKIAAIAECITETAEQVIDAQGCIITPGLIDFHTHIYNGGTDIGIVADSSYIPTGVTAAVDAGSAGSATFDAYMRGCISNTLIRTKSFINVCPSGMGTMKFHEVVSEKCIDIDKTKLMVEKYRQQIIGLKIRASADIVGQEGLKPIVAAIKLAEELKLPLAVHTTNPPVLAGELVDLLRSGDIYVHCYQGTGNSIIEGGTVSEQIKNARRRGVIFDAANGGNHWVFAVAEQAMLEGFYPDVISTDLTVKTLFKEPVHSLPYIMSKYLNMGMDLYEIVKACTQTPAQLMGMQSQIGSLQVGAFADIAILKLLDCKVVFKDTKKQERVGNRLLANKMTVLNGKIAYRTIDF